MVERDARAQLGLLAASPEEVSAASEAEAMEYDRAEALSPSEARELVDSIRGHLESAREKIKRLHEGRGWEALEYRTWEQCISAEFPESRSYVYRQLAAADIESTVSPNGSIGRLPERQLRPLAALPKEEQAAAWAEVTASRERVSAGRVEAVVERRKLEMTSKPSIGNGRELVTVETHRAAALATFNETNQKVDWARWTWNPVTGCLHDCPYCYARDIAVRFYPQGFAPTFHRDRLAAPKNTRMPPNADERSRRVFTCSMADLFGKWVPQEWIDAVFEQVRDSPQWEFLFLTKFPQRLAELEWPENAWVGTTVDRQYRVDIAEKAFCGVKAGVKWLSCEPLLEPLRFKSLEMFDWVVIGGASRSSQTPEFWPPFEWVVDLYNQARAAGCKVWFKPNAVCGLTKFPREMPR